MSYLSQRLGAQRCCSIPTQGPPGPVGPNGVGLIGQMGSTGPNGQSVTGPTGRGCLGPTGPLGSNMGSTGPTGSNNYNYVNTSILSAVYNLSTSTITLPAPSTIVSYYTVLITGGNLTTINATSLPAGYQATVLVGTTSTTTPSTVTISNANNVQVSNYGSVSNPNLGNVTLTLLAQTIGYPQYVSITILSDGTYYYANVIALTNEPPSDY